MTNKGMTINCSMVRNDDEYELGFKYQDTDGVEFDGTYNSNDPEEMLEDLFNDVLEEILLSQTLNEKEEEEDKDNETLYEKELKKIISDLTAENESLKTDVSILQKRMDDLINDSVNKKSETKTNNFENKTMKNRYYSFDPMSRLMKIWF